MAFERKQVKIITDELESSSKLIQVVIGPRQVGKTTAASQIISHLGWPTVFESADAALPLTSEWIENNWRRAQVLAKNTKTLLVIDEIQKIPGWSETIKKLWDKEVREGGLVRPLLLGSSALLLQQGLTESLAGRFFLHRFSHWGADECSEAFGWDLEQWIFFGGYPGSAQFIHNESTWKQYVADSLIETVLGKDVLQLQTVNKPALLRQLFALAATYPAQIFSYNKMLGQLLDAGNTTTLAHYLTLLETAFLLSGLEQYAKGKPRKRGSSPKLIAWNNALISAQSRISFEQFQTNLSWRGRLIENAVGAKLLNELQSFSWSINYWREGNKEIDFIVTQGASTYAIEVKSGRPEKAPAIKEFKKHYPDAIPVIIGSGGIELGEFFNQPVETFLGGI